MSKITSQKLISSKEILEKTSISRATLNNYIKTGIIPKPLIRTPENGEKNIKKLGYFPDTVLESIGKVQVLKRKGRSMVEIARILSDQFIPEQEDEKEALQDLPEENLHSPERYSEQVYKEGLKLSVGEISEPAYLLNYDFEIVWINRRAENEVLNQRITPVREDVCTNIFRLFFNWGFHSRIKNWKDLVTFHIAFVKFKYSRTWLNRLYKGMSQGELDVLEKLYDSTSASYHHIISNTPVNLLMQDSSTEKYCIYSVFFNEGILFIYNPAGESSG